MKKGLLIPLLALIVAVQAKADWSITDSTLTITSDYSYNYAMDYPWHSQRKAIKNVIVEDGVKAIGKYAFQGYKELYSVSFPSSLTSIDQWSFQGCEKLSRVSIPEGVVSIGNYAFEKCSNLSIVYLPNSVTSYGFMAFANSSSDLSVHAESIETPVEILGDDVFDSNTTIYIVEGMNDTFVAAWGDKYTYKEVDWYFYDGTLTILSSYDSDYPWEPIRSDIKSVIIKDGVETIGNEAFENCDQLTNVIIPNSVRVIGSRAFSNCKTLTSIRIPNSVRMMSDGVFEGDSSLMDVTLSNNLSIINDRLFYGCSNLQSVDIPQSVTEISTGAFTNCSSLTNITIPDGISSIGTRAFYGCRSLSNIVIPDGVTTIEWATFGECNNLESIVIPQTVKSIGEHAFDGCEKLASIDIPTKVTSIVGGAFRKCTSLTTIVIPNSVTTIDGETFKDCSSLTKVILPEGITSIGNGAFQNCRSLTNITIPTSVIKIGENAFRECHSLTSIEIPRSVSNIGMSALAYCNSLKTINVATDNETLDSRDNCNAIIDTKTNKLITGCSTTIIPNSVKVLGDYAFSFECSDTFSITIPQSIDSIGYRTFVAFDNLIIHAEYVPIPAVLKPNDYGIVSSFRSGTVIYIPQDTREAYVAAWGKDKYYIEPSDIVKINAVIAKIEAIGTVEYSDSCKALIDEAQKAYDELIDVGNCGDYIINKTDYCNTLVSATITYDNLKNKERPLIEAVWYKINAIGTVEYTDACKSLIDEAQAAYEALTETQKAHVTNAETLTEAIATYESLQPATGIKEIFYKRNSNDNAWYDLLGHKFDTKPTVPGLYIHQGERVLVK